MIGSLSTNLDVVILVGGRGTRIQSIHPETPKPMVPVLGKPFLHWLTLYLASFNLRRFIYSTGYRAEQVEAWCVSRPIAGIEQICRQETDPLGTGGGLLNCMPACKDWILVANGDGLCMAGLPELLSLAGSDVSGGLIGLRVPDASRYGTLEFRKDARLTAFREKVRGAGYINSGFYLFRKSALESVERSGFCSIETDLMPDLLRRGADMRVVPLEEGAFIDIGTPATLALAEAFVRTNLRHRLTEKPAEGG